MAMARLAVSVTCHTAQNGEATYWLGVVAFGKQADDLARHRKGDMVSVSGSLQLNQWKAQDGTAAAIKARNAIPELKENADYTAQKSQLEMLKNATDANGKLLISQEQYSAASEQLELEHQVRLSKIRAQQVSANPIAEARGEIDPVQALANQNNQKLALMAQYYQQEQAALVAARQQNSMTEEQYQQQKLATDTQYQALINAQRTQYEQQQTDALWTMLSQQGLGYDMLTSAVDAFAGNASNALTGLLTGSMSAEDAMRSLASTMLNSVVNSLVQVGVEALKNFIIGQTIGQAATAAGMAQAMVLTNAWVPAAYAASVATGGAAAKVGAVAYGSGLGIAQALSIAGGRKNGGPVSPGNVYPVGEGNLPEFMQTSKGLFMIPGDNGKVFSNSDVTGGAPMIQRASTGSAQASEAAKSTSGNSGSGQNGAALPPIINVYQYSDNSQVDVQHSKSLTGQDVIDIVSYNIQQGGRVGQQIATSHNAPRKATG